MTSQQKATEKEFAKRVALERKKSGKPEWRYDNKLVQKLKNAKEPGTTYITILPVLFGPAKSEKACGNTYRGCLRQYLNKAQTPDVYREGVDDRGLIPNNFIFTDKNGTPYSNMTLRGAKSYAIRCEVPPQVIYEVWNELFPECEIWQGDQLPVLIESEPRSSSTPGYVLKKNK